MKSIFEDSEFASLVAKIEKLFPVWKMKALLGEDPDYTEEIGYDIAKNRALVRSYDKALKSLEARRKELYENLQDTCPHDYVAEVAGDPESRWDHQKYDKRICEVCALYENGPGGKYNLYDDLSDAKLGRTMMRRVNQDEFKRIENLIEIIHT